MAMSMASRRTAGENKAVATATTPGQQAILGVSEDMSWSVDQHGITIAVEAVLLCDSFSIRGENPLAPGQGHSQE